MGGMMSLISGKYTVRGGDSKQFTLSEVWSDTEEKTLVERGIRRQKYGNGQYIPQPDVQMMINFCTSVWEF
jgi:hypothetical protein